MKYVIGTNPEICRIKSPRFFSIRNKSDQPCVLVFKKEEDARMFSKFLIENKCRYTKWPELNMSTQKVNYETKTNEFKCHLPNYVNNFIQVVECNENKLDTYLSLNGINVVLGDKFTYDNKSLEINMDVAERNYEYKDTFELIRNLESNYK